MKYGIVILILSAIGVTVRIFRGSIIRWLMSLRTKLQIRSLRHAIADADNNKSTTGRKTMVVFNRTAGSYETVEKKTLKTASNLFKNKNNAKMTEGRKKMAKKKPARAFDPKRVKTIEKKSLYVTD